MPFWGQRSAAPSAIRKAASDVGEAAAEQQGDSDEAQPVLREHLLQLDGSRQRVTSFQNVGGQEQQLYAPSPEAALHQTVEHPPPGDPQPPTDATGEDADNNAHANALVDVGETRSATFPGTQPTRLGPLSRLREWGTVATARKPTAAADKQQTLCAEVEQQPVEVQQLKPTDSESEEESDEKQQHEQLQCQLQQQQGEQQEQQQQQQHEQQALQVEFDQPKQAHPPDQSQATCHVCAALQERGEADDVRRQQRGYRAWFRRTGVSACPLCRRSACPAHRQPMTFPHGVLPMKSPDIDVCRDCIPDARALIEDDVARARTLRISQAQRRRIDSVRKGHLSAVPEQSKQCIECGAFARNSCKLCGLATCHKDIILAPAAAGLRAVGRVQVCSYCTGHAGARAEANGLVRGAVASFFRQRLAAASFQLALADGAPELEQSPDCAGCGLSFTRLPGSLRHHCRACGRSLCAVCLCGESGCLAKGPVCPHKGIVHLFGHEREERVCCECLFVVQTRTAARGVLQAVNAAALRNIGYYDRVVAFLASPSDLPLYEQDYVDTAASKATRVGGFAVEGAKMTLPILSMPAAIGVRAVDVLWNYGQYGLVGLLVRDEIIQVVKTLVGLSDKLRDITPRDLVVGLCYLSADQRKAFRSDPGAVPRQVSAAGGYRAPDELIDGLISLTVLGAHAPYQEAAFDAQLYSVQQGWRLVAERLGESWKHKPAWALFMRPQPPSLDQRLAVIAVRGTSLEASFGGDLFTDLNVVPRKVTSYRDGRQIMVHSGVFEAAAALESELRPTLQALAKEGYRIALTGHSLGGAVASMILWLLHNGDAHQRLPDDAVFFGVGYGVPSIVDRATAEALRPHFTSVVNSTDIVPRLSVATVTRLGREIASCAQECGADLDEDVRQYVQRAAALWEPRLRSGAPLAAADSPAHAVGHSPDDCYAGQSDATMTHASEQDTATEEEVLELFVPGSVLWLHRVDGHLEASLVPCDIPLLRRITLDNRMLDDHGSKAYHASLRAVRARRAVEATAPPIRWQGFAQAGDTCRCCGSAYNWMTTARSVRQLSHAMTNCRMCGFVVCVSCASTRRPVLEQGIQEPVRACDRCVWRGPPGGDALLASMPQLLLRVAGPRPSAAADGACP